MAVARILIVLLLIPTAAAAQLPSPPIYPHVIQPGAPYNPAIGVIDIAPRTPPPSTIPSGPDIFLPVPTVAPGVERPRKPFDFQPSVSLIEEYSDNFNQTSKRERSNLRSGVAPAIRVLFEDGPFSAQAGYDLLAFYDTFTEDTGFNHAFAGRFSWQVTPLFRLGVTDSFTRSDDPARADRLSLRRGRQEFTSNTAAANADYLASFLQAGAYYRLSTFDATDDQTTSHTIGMNVTRPLGPIHSIGFGYEYLNTETESRPSTAATTPTTGFASTSTTRRTTTTTGHQFSTTFTRDLRKDMSAGLTGTYALREQEQTAARDVDFRRWNVALFTNYVVPETIVLLSNIGVGQLTGGGSDGKLLLTSFSGLTYYLGPAILNGTLERGFSETFGTGENNGVVETFGVAASLSYRFTPFLTANIGGSYRENKTTGVGGGQTGTGSEEKTTVGSAAVSYQILRWLVSTLDYAHTQVDSKDNSLNGRSYKENRIRLTLSALFY